MRTRILLPNFKMKNLSQYLKPTTLLVGALLSYSTSYSQGVAEGTANNVDLFSGDFTYEVPLLNVTGPNGENFPLVLNYRSGIRVEQDASWVGLGWDLPIGSISRSVNGVPDDWKNIMMKDTLGEPNASSSSTIRTITSSHAYGPLYFKDYPQSSSNNNTPDVVGTNKITRVEDLMDVYQSSRQMIHQASAFEFPDYDQFYVSGPGIGGEMGLHLFDFATLRHKDFDDYQYCDNNTLSDEYMPFTKTPQFLFKRGALTQNKAPYYGNGYGNGIASYTQMNNSNTYIFYRDPQELLKANVDNAKTNWDNTNNQGLTSSDPGYIPYPFPGDNEDWGNDYDNGTNRMHEGNYVQYFTNSEINNFDPNNSQNALTVKGFLDYKVNSNRNIPNSDDQIGAIQVTDISGKTYHYSLPVYRYSEANISFRLNNDFSFNPTTRNFSIHRKEKPYASEWKLTAITGPDYIDHNKNGIADEGDKGYWIALEYTVWDKEHDFRAPHFGYYTDLQTKIQHFKNQMNNWDNTLYAPTGSVVKGKETVVYLDKIKTATQTAYFVKSIRRDAHGAEGEPLLKLEKVVLLDNEDLAVFPETQNIDADGTNLPSTLGALTTINTKQYQANATAIQNKALRIAELEQDYSLSPNLYNHFDSQYSSTKVGLSAQPSISLLEIDNFVPQVNSGKLSLNSVSFLEEKGEKVYPSIDFDYNVSDNLDNPNYNHKKASYFGFYKATTNRSGYITTADSGVVDAWCLRSIETPLGGKIKINYEVDRYSGISYDSWNGKPVPPVRTFRIKDISGSLSNPTFEFYNADAIPLFDEINSNTSTSNVVEKSLFVPYKCGSCLGTSSFIDPNGSTSSLGPSEIKFFGLSIPSSCSNSSCVAQYDKNGGHGFGYLRLKLKQALGGGVRVASIEVEEPERNESYTLDFSYENGIATTEPDLFMPDGANTHSLMPSRHGGDRHSLSPAVGYSNVSITSNNPGSAGIGTTAYEFINVADPFIPQVVQGVPVTTSSNNVDFHFDVFEVIKVTDGNGNYGKMRSMKQFDEDGDLIASIYNEYETDRERMGRVEEIFHRAHLTPLPLGFRGRGKVEEVHSIFYKVIQNGYLKRSTTVRDGVTSVVEFLQHDPYATSPTEILTTEASSGATSTSSKLLYTNSAYSQLGPKSVDPSYKNRLALTEEERVFRNTDLIAGQFKGYSDQVKVRSFNNGVLSNSMTTAPLHLPLTNKVFEGAALGTPSLWKKSRSVELFDENYQVLEISGIGDDNYSAIRYGYNNRFPIANASGANYASFTWSGFESTTIYDNGAYHYADGEVLLPQASFRVTADATAKPHSGNYQIKLPSSTFGSSNCPIFKTAENTINGNNSGLLTNRRYRASVWMHESNTAGARLVVALKNGNGNFLKEDGSINTAQVPIYKHINDADESSGSWKQVNIEFTVPASSSGNYELGIYLENASGNSSAYFDDLMLHPLDATVSAVVREEKTGRTLYKIGSTNFYSRYEYDAAGRTTKVFVETESGEKKLSENRYGFAKNL